MSKFKAIKFSLFSIVFIFVLAICFSLIEFSDSFADNNQQNQTKIHVNIHLSNSTTFDYTDAVTGEYASSVKEIQADFDSSDDIRYSISANETRIYGFNLNQIKDHDFNITLSENIGGLTLAKTEIDEFNFEYCIVVAPKYQVTLHTDEGKFFGSPDPNNRIINVVEGSSISLDGPSMLDQNRVFVGFYTSVIDGEFIPNGSIVPAKDTWNDNTLFARIADISQEVSCIVKSQDPTQEFLYSTQMLSYATGEVSYFATDSTSAFDALKVDGFTSYPGSEQIHWGAGYLDIIMDGYCGEMSNAYRVEINILDSRNSENCVLNSFTFNGGKLVGEGYINIPQVENNTLEIGFTKYSDNSINISSNNRMPFMATKLVYFDSELISEDTSITSSYNMDVDGDYHASYVYGDSEYVRRYLDSKLVMRNSQTANDGVPLFVCLSKKYVADNQVCMDFTIYVFQDLYYYESNDNQKRDKIINCFLDNQKLNITASLNNFDDLGKDFVFEMSGEQINYPATFDANGGHFSDFQSVIDIDQTVGTNYNFPVEPIKEGYKFLGWYSLPEGGDQCFVSDYVFDPIDQHFVGTFYAHWEQVPNVNPNGDNLYSNVWTGDNIHCIIIMLFVSLIAVLISCLLMRKKQCL